MLYKEKMTQSGSIEDTNGYDVFRADPQDITYTQNFYNGSDSSINLWKGKKPLTANFAAQSKEISNQYTEKKLSKQAEKNKAGLVNFDKDTPVLEDDIFKADPPKVKLSVLNS